MNRRRALMSAVSSSPAPVHGTWEDLFARIADGTYATAYQLGEILPLDLGTEGAVNAQIVAFNADDKADNSGKAKVTFITQYTLDNNQRFNPQRAVDPPYAEGTGTVGGWEKSEIRAYVQSTVKELIPSKVRNRIVAVKKYTRGYDTQGSSVNNVETSDDVWIPSAHEIATSTNYENVGVTYLTWFNSTSRKIKDHTTGASTWFHRSAYSSNAIVYHNSSGNFQNNRTAHTTGGYAIGFCID